MVWELQEEPRPSTRHRKHGCASFPRERYSLADKIFMLGVGEFDPDRICLPARIVLGVADAGAGDTDTINGCLGVQL